MQITLFYMNGTFVSFDIENAPLFYKENFFGKPLDIPKPKTPIFNSKMAFSFYEALFLLKNKKVVIKNLNNNQEMKEEEIIREAENYIHDFQEKYLVYEDLRKNGFIPKPGMKYGVTFMVYKYGPGIDHAPFLVNVKVREEKLEIIDIIRAGRLSHSVRKKLLLAMVDRESKKITYYLFKWFL